MGQKRHVDMDLSKSEDDSPQLTKKGKAIKASKTSKDSKESKDKKESKVKKAKPKKSRSRRYRLIRTKVDRTKTFPLPKALKLLLSISNTKFDASVETNLNLTESGQKYEVAFPHPTGKTKKVAIATDTLLKQVTKNKIDFDILIASPDMMPKLAKHARVLGPKGLMPNPKDGTISKDPKSLKKQLESGKTILKSEKKAPLLHTVIGKTNQPQKQLEANILELVKVINPQNLTKLTISSSMSPGIKIDISNL